MHLAIPAALAVLGAVAGYAFRGAIRKDIAKVVAAVKAEEAKAATAVQAEAKKL